MNISIQHKANERVHLSKEKRAEVDGAILKLCVYNGELEEFCGKLKLTDKGYNVIAPKHRRHASF